MAHAALDIRGTCREANAGHKPIFKKEAKRVSLLAGCNIEMDDDVNGHWLGPPDTHSSVLGAVTGLPKP